MAGVSPLREGGFTGRSRSDIGPLARAALPRWLARADGEARALVDLVTIAVEASTPEQIDAAAHALRVALPVHIAAEERAGGMFSMALAVAPEHAATMRRLLEDHDALLGQLATLDPEQGRGDALRTLCSSILEHEQREAELLAAIADRVTSPVS